MFKQYSTRNIGDALLHFVALEADVRFGGTESSRLAGYSALVRAETGGYKGLRWDCEGREG